MTNNNNKSLEEIYDEIIKDYSKEINNLLKWLQTTDSTTETLFNNYIIASSYLLTFSYFQDTFISIIHKTIDFHSMTSWDQKPQFIKDMFCNLIEKYIEYNTIEKNNKKTNQVDIVIFSSTYQNCFQDFFKNEGRDYPNKNQKFINHCNSYYKLDTNKYNSLKEKFEKITKINIDAIESLRTYENIVNKRNKYAHNKPPHNIDYKGSSLEIKSFLNETVDWLEVISKKLLNNNL